MENKMTKLQVVTMMLANAEISANEVFKAYLENEKALLEKNVTVLFVSHNVEQVRSLCNKAIILDHGKMLAFGDSEEICNQYEEMTNS